MVFSNLSLFVVFFILFVWISILTIWVLKLYRHYNALTKGITKTGLKEILEMQLHVQKDTGNKVQKIESQIESIINADKLHTQKVGIVRFNPFSDTGGAQSFTVAFLDGTNSGIVMTSLYGRNGNRWYVKEIRNSRGKELELSKEEEAAIKKAQNVDAI